MKVMRFDSSEKVHVKALIYGKPGTGKTTMGVTAPKPLILLSERQGMTHVRHAAAMIGRQPIGVLHMRDLNDYRMVLRTLLLATRNPDLRSESFVIRDDAGEIVFESPEWPETIVLDSVTDACRLVDAQIMVESPPKLGKDNLPVNSERYWSVLKDRCEKLIRGFRDIDFHVLYLCLEDDKTIGEGEEAERKVGPALPMRSLPDTVAAAVNVVGVMSRKIRRADSTSDDAEIDYLVRTVGPQWYLLKPFRPLHDVEVADFSSWVDRLTHTITTGTNPVEAETPPETQTPVAPARPRTRRGNEKASKATANETKEGTP
jgi:hypothetical protein